MLLNPVRFPNAVGQGCKETSVATPEYNCIAYVAGDTERNWWPNSAPNGYWPKGIPEKTTIYAFLRLFRSLGYENCGSGALEDGYEKVAIYALNNVVTHAALQLQNGHWTSKIGHNIDIEHHTLDALDGPFYGNVVRFLKRSI